VQDEFISKRVGKIFKPKKPYERSKRKCETINCRINRFTHFTEYIYFKEPIEVWSGGFDYDWVDNETGEIISKQKRREIIDQEEIDEWASRGQLLVIDGEYAYYRSLYESSRRAKDNFYGYALCNEWLYFCTFTVGKNDYDFSDEATKNYWKLFKMRLQYKFADIKILAVPERHNSGNIHFHALLGDCDLESLLVIAINPNTKKPIIRKGRQVYNLPLWDKGFSTVVKIETGNLENQLKAINYIIGYVTKYNNHIGENKKRYYRTTNLKFKETQTKFITEVQHKKMLQDVENGKLKLYKETDTMKVFRVYN